jgi:hypothetical protein
MSVILRYRAFKQDLRGFAEIDFNEFRARILPLRASLLWDLDMAKYAADLLKSGAGCALQRLCGLKHPAAIKVLGAAKLKADPMSRAELDDHMRALTKSCLLDGWLPEQFIRFALYLDGSTDLKKMAELERESHNNQVEELKAAGLRPAPEAGVDAPTTNDAPKKDHFAEMYRAASPAFKRAVKEHLVVAAEMARA